MKQRTLRILYIACILLACGMFSCYKGEQFLGQTEFTTTVTLEAFIAVDSAKIDVTIDDTTWNDIKLSKTGRLEPVLATLPFKIPSSGNSHIVIKWNDSVVIADTNITVKSKNTYYLLQFKDDQPPSFLTSFGESAATPPDSGFIKARFYYRRSDLDLTPWPDTVRIEFTTLITPAGGGATAEIPDTSLLMTDGQVTSYIQLRNSKKTSIMDPDVAIGYRIIHPVTSAVLQDFCYSPIKFGTIELNPSIGGELFQIFSFDYIEPDPGVPGCNFGSVEMYMLKPLF